MKKIRNVTLYLSLLFVGFLNAQSQTAFQHLKENVENIIAFNKYLPQEKVYLHFDNTGYFKGETIWFKAYVARTDRSCLSDLSHVLYVELVTPGGDVIETKKFCIKDGEADGCLKLDDKILESGFYEVRAYTRYMTNWDNDCIFSRVFPIFKKPTKEGDYSKRVIAEHSYVQRLPDYRESADTLKVKVKKINARFYPEGGNLVQGLTSTVAFDIYNEEGAHIAADVYVIRGTDTITSSKTEYQGRGLLRYTPDGEACRILITDSSGHHREFSLPESLQSGYVLTVNTQNSKSVMMHVNSSPDLYGKGVCWVVTHNGMIESADTATAGADGIIRQFLRDELESGVNQITLMDDEGHVVADRLFFNYPHDQSDTISVTSSTANLSPCKKVSLDMNTLPQTSFSLSVRDVATETNGYNQNVQTWLLLTSDLNGFIENPEFYLEVDDALHRHAADLLMLVQGWRRYDMAMMTGRKKFVKREPLEDALYIDGRLHQVKKKNPVSQVSLSATLYNGQGYTMSGNGITDANGYYAMKLPDCEDEWTMLMYTKKNDELTKYNIGIDRHFSPQRRHINYAETQITPPDKPNLFFISGDDASDSSVFVPMDKRNHVLKEVKVKGHHIFENARAGWENERNGAYRSSMYYNCADAADEIADKGEDMPEIHNWLCKRNPFFDGTSSHNGITSGNTGNNMNTNKSSENTDNKNTQTNRDEIHQGDGSSTIVINNKNMIIEENLGFSGRINPGISYKNRPIIWILNNVFYEITGYNGKFVIDDVKNAVNFSNEELPVFLDELKSVYISEDANVWWRYIMKDDLTGRRPVTVFVYTYHKFAKNVKGLRRTHFEGFAKSETFRMNDYSLMPPEADYRRTLYWNPNVTTDKDGRAKIDFYNNSSCKQIFISAEGITKDGVPIIYKDK